MSHFAQIDENNKVIQVLVGDNNAPDEGLSFFETTLGGRWIQTSYNGNIRKNFAAINYFYDETLDAFIPPKPYDSWILDETLCRWMPPVAYPQDGSVYIWNEDLGEWVNGQIMCSWNSIKRANR